MSAYGPLASFYDQLTEDVDYRGLYAYLMWHFNSGGVTLRRVLDMACGTGSLSMQFAARGVETLGMDLSEEMLVRAWEKAVDGLVCMLDSFNYLTDPADGIRALVCFYEALAPGGMLIFDIRPRRQLMAFDGQIFMDETDDVCCIWRTEFDESENICFYGMDLFIREGDLWKRSREEHYEYGYRLRWLKMEMEKIGFRQIRFYGDRTMAPPTERDERVFITARKE